MTMIPLSALVKQGKPQAGQPVNINGSSYIPETQTQLGVIQKQNDDLSRIISSASNLTHSTDFSLMSDWNRRKIDAYSWLKYHLPNGAVDSHEMDKQESQMSKQNQDFFNLMTDYKNAYGYTARNAAMIDRLQNALVGPDSNEATAKSTIAEILKNAVVDQAYNNKIMQFGQPQTGEDAAQMRDFNRQARDYYDQRMEQLLKAGNDFATASSITANELNGQQDPEATPEQLKAAGIAIPQQAPAQAQQQESQDTNQQPALLQGQQ